VKSLAPIAQPDRAAAF